MSSNQLKTTQDEGDVRLNDFLQQLTAIRKALNEVDQVVSDVAQNLEEVIGPDEFETGSITGNLEHINLHARPGYFYVYPTMPGRSKIKCLFSEGLREEAMAALDKRVTVYGRLKYRHNQSQPYEVEVREIEVLEGDAPKLSELRGVAKGLLGDKTTEEYLAEVRNEW
jgi:hypothetical protein